MMNYKTSSSISFKSLSTINVHPSTVQLTTILLISFVVRTNDIIKISVKFSDPNLFISKLFYFKDLHLNDIMGLVWEWGEAFLLTYVMLSTLHLNL